MIFFTLLLVCWHVIFVTSLPARETDSVIVDRGVEASKKQHAHTNSTWWYANIDHTSAAVRDYVPNLGTTYDYPVHFSVQAGNAVEFVSAITADGPQGQRDDMWLAGQPRTIYLPGGIYVLETTVTLLTDTVIIGDPTDPPILQAAPGFDGEFLIVGGAPGYVTAGNGGELHFSVMLKNIILDTTRHADSENFVALSWRVAQNTALVNVEIRMPPASHTGIWMGQGSVLSVADTKFVNGRIGVHYEGMQQATLKNMRFENCTTGILIDDGFTVNIFAPTFHNVTNPVVLNSGSPWISVIDGTAVSSGTFFRTNTLYPNFMIENVRRDSNESPVVIVGSDTKLEEISPDETYVYGNTYGAEPIYQTDVQPRKSSRPTALAPNGRYPVLVPPQYPEATAADVINLKDPAQNGGHPVYGDGQRDDSIALQAGLDLAASSQKIAYLPHGIYRLTSTLTIPSGTRLVGNAWSTLSGYGPFFANASSPHPVVKIGDPDSLGTAVLQDLRFTVGQALPGAILLQINMAGDSPGDVAIFNSLITIGGTRDTEIDCYAESSPPSPPTSTFLPDLHQSPAPKSCLGAYIGLHLSKSSSAYVENVWTWLADHEVDSATNSHTRIAARYGVVVEAASSTTSSSSSSPPSSDDEDDDDNDDSERGTWLIGLASEHFWVANLWIKNAKNVLVTLFQSETNYNQGVGASSSGTTTTTTSWDPSSSSDDDDDDEGKTPSSQVLSPQALFSSTSTTDEEGEGDEEEGPDFSWCSAPLPSSPPSSPSSSSSSSQSSSPSSRSLSSSRSRKRSSPARPNCYMTLAQYISGSSKNVFSYGSASWNFFHGSQETLNFVGVNSQGERPGHLRLFGLCAHGVGWIMGLRGMGDGAAAAAEAKRGGGGGGLKGGRGKGRGRVKGSGHHNGAGGGGRGEEGGGGGISVQRFGQGSVDGFSGAWGTLVAELSVD
jgi:hypothetical protein